MKFDKKMYGIYMTSAVITVGLLYMGVSSYYIANDVFGQTSADLAIDRMVDECWEKHHLSE